MNIKRHPNFKKHYRQRIANNPKLVKRTMERLRLFQENSSNPVLKDHQLKGEKSEFRAFSVNGDIRIVYLPDPQDEVILLDIGSHNQVY